MFKVKNTYNFNISSIINSGYGGGDGGGGG